MRSKSGEVDSSFLHDQGPSFMSNLCGEVLELQETTSTEMRDTEPCQLNQPNYFEAAQTLQEVGAGSGQISFGFEALETLLTLTKQKLFAR